MIPLVLEFSPSNHHNLVSEMGFFIIILLFIILSCTFVVFFMFYTSLKHIIGPLMLNDDLNDLEFGRFAYNYDLELHEEMLDEVSSNIEKEAESKFIDRLLPSVKYEEDEEIKLKYEDCAICLNDYRDGELCRIFPMCKHMFHSDCIDIWLEKSLTCPICRQYVFGSS
uniref:RING-type domain-containing protein n=2 Tax=Manihot esculenta TaxID=3983 RepID=A0A2C9UFC1_MANES